MATATQFIEDYRNIGAELWEQTQSFLEDTRKRGEGLFQSIRTTTEEETAEGGYALEAISSIALEAIGNPVSIPSFSGVEIREER